MLAATYGGIMSLNSSPRPSLKPFYVNQSKIWADIAAQYDARKDLTRAENARGVAAAYRRLGGGPQ
jgi:hypothetical protein